MTNDEQQLDLKIRQVFNVDQSKESNSYPPHQIFINPSFKFLLTIGGNLVGNKKEYEKLMILLQDLGEKDFYVVENIGATLPHKDRPFIAKVPVTSDFLYFDKITKDYNPHFGLLTGNFFIFGENTNWGIYLCEYPTINIVGCTQELTEKFRKIFNIKGNGYTKLRSFIKREFVNKENLIKQLESNYKLDTK